MKLQVIRAGFLEEFLPQSMMVEYNGSPVLEDFIHFLEKKKGPGVKELIVSGTKLKKHITILVNGRSIRARKDGLDIPIYDGDVIVFCIMINGG